MTNEQIGELRKSWAVRDLALTYICQRIVREFTDTKESMDEETAILKNEYIERAKRDLKIS